jgi:hypothetical protein
LPYPQFQAGQRITAALLNAGKMEFVTNAAGAQTTTSTSLVDATDLVFAVEANGRYKIDLAAAFGGATTVDGICAWTAPTGSTMGRNIISMAQGATSNEDANAVLIRRGTGTLQEFGTTNSANSFTVHRELIDLQVGSTAGDVQFQFGVDLTGTITLQADSMIWYQRVE